MDLDAGRTRVDTPRILNPPKMILDAGTQFLDVRRTLLCFQDVLEVFRGILGAAKSVLASSRKPLGVRCSVPRASCNGLGTHWNVSEHPRSVGRVVFAHRGVMGLGASWSGASKGPGTAQDPPERSTRMQRRAETVHERSWAL